MASPRRQSRGSDGGSDQRAPASHACKPWCRGCARAKPGRPACWRPLDAPASADVDARTCDTRR
eukprot:1182542-Prymnesium_polylepis.1